MSEPHQVLGVEPDATWDEVSAARRRLAKALHPDVHHGPDRSESEQRLAAVNQAFDQLRVARNGAPAPAEHSVEPDSGEAGLQFSIDALPVVAFEAVLLAAVELGDVIHVDEPYLLGVLVDHPGPCQCLIDLVPEAGGTIATIDLGSRAFGVFPSGDAVCDYF